MFLFTRYLLLQVSDYFYYFSMEYDPKRDLLIETFLAINEKINLSAVRDYHGVYVKHILDSIELEKVIDLRALNANAKSKDWLFKVADIGTGGGFPLLPLAIQYPEVEFVGIDSVRKKLQAISDMANILDIKNVRLERKRIEEVREKFDVITARAVAHVDKLIPRVHTLLKPTAILILYKEYKAEERNTMIQLLSQYGLTLTTEHRYSLFEGDISRVIYTIHKL